MQKSLYHEGHTYSVQVICGQAVELFIV